MQSAAVENKDSRPATHGGGQLLGDLDDSIIRNSEENNTAARCGFMDVRKGDTPTDYAAAGANR